MKNPYRKKKSVLTQKEVELFRVHLLNLIDCVLTQPNEVFEKFRKELKTPINLLKQGLPSIINADPEQYFYSVKEYTVKAEEVFEDADEISIVFIGVMKLITEIDKCIVPIQIKK